MCNIIGFVIILGGLEGCAICLCIAFGYGELDRMMRLMRVTKRKNGDAGAVILAKLLKFMETNEIRSKRKSTWLLLFLLVGDTCACILSSCTWSFKHSLRCHLTELADPNHSVFYACRFWYHPFPIRVHSSFWLATHVWPWYRLIHSRPLIEPNDSSVCISTSKVPIWSSPFYQLSRMQIQNASINKLSRLGCIRRERKCQFLI